MKKISLQICCLLTLFASAKLSPVSATSFNCTDTSVSVSVSPASVTVESGDTQQFAATVAGSLNTSVTWTATDGSVSSSGLFTAPIVSTSETVTVTATSVADNTKSASASVSVTGSGSSVSGVGCGVGSGGTTVLDQSTCGNYAGAPYEDLNTASPTTPPSPTGSGTLHSISACGTIVPTTGDVWRFTGDINDGAGGTNQQCIYYGGNGGNNFVIDLAGHTLTGGIQCNQNLGGHDCSGITVVNGKITCNIANGGSEGCLYFNQQNNPTQSVMWTHLTINNINSPSNPDTATTAGSCAGQTGIGYCGYEFAGLYASFGTTPSPANLPPGAAQKTFGGAAIEFAHLTIADAAGYTGAGYPTNGWCARCTGLQVDGSAGVTVEAWNNVILNSGYIDAHQGFLCYNTGTCLMHNNYAPWVKYQGVQDTGRPFMFDAAGKVMNQVGGQIYNNLVEDYNNRCVRTRQVNNVKVHDNRFEHVESSIVDPCIMMGGDGDYSEYIGGNLVSNNTFLMAGGNAIEAAESYGLVADSNTFLCDPLGPCNTGYLAAAWLAEGNNGLSYTINSASRTASCVVTLTLAYPPTTTSFLAGQVYVNVSGRSDDFNVSGTAGNLLTSNSGSTITYTQAGCAGANTGTSGGIFWMAESKTDNYPSNGAKIYIKNSIVDPLLTMSQPFVACGQTGNPIACQNNPMSGQAEILYCNNTQSGVQIAATGGTGATVTHQTPDASCP